MAPLEDGELMLRYARGDLRAFAELYARHRGPLYRYLARQTRDREVASDLFQEVWSRVIARREQYEPRAPFRTFLFRIAHNCFIDHQRRRAVRAVPAAATPLEFEGESPAERVPAPASETPDMRAQESEFMRRYHAALMQLPAEQRDVFLLCQQSELTLEEVATITGVGVETAKSRLRYALSKLRSALGADAPPAAGGARRSQRASPAPAPARADPSAAAVPPLLPQVLAAEPD